MTPNRTRAEQIINWLKGQWNPPYPDELETRISFIEQALDEAELQGNKQGTLKGLEMAKQIALKEEVGAEAAYDYAGSIAQEIDAKAKELEDGK